MQTSEEARAKLATLTEKQRAVLDLVRLYKSSKEIARTLKISPHTVDQRIAVARSKLGASSRGELARIYNDLCKVCEEPIYQSSQVPFSTPPVDDQLQARKDDPVYTFADVAVIEHRAPWDAGPERLEGLEAFDRQFGIAGRLAAIVLLAGILALILLAMVSMAKTLTDLL